MATNIQQFPSAYPMGYKDSNERNIEALGQAIGAIRNAVHQDYNAKISKVLTENLNKPLNDEQKGALQTILSGAGNPEKVKETTSALVDFTNIDLEQKLAGTPFAKDAKRPGVLGRMMGMTPDIKNIELAGQKTDRLNNILNTLKAAHSAIEKESSSVSRGKASEFTPVIKDAKEKFAKDISTFEETILDLNWEGIDKPIDNHLKSSALRGVPWEEAIKGLSPRNQIKAETIRADYEEVANSASELKQYKKERLDWLPGGNPRKKTMKGKTSSGVGYTIR